MGLSLYSFRARLTNSLCALFLIACAITLSGCATKQQAPGLGVTDPVTQHAAAELWKHYVDASTERNIASPFRIGASLRYTTPDSGHRLILRAWGNGIAPVRLDLEAGVGQTLALIRQDKNAFIAYDPRANMAYINNDSSNVLIRFGLPIPFGISELGHLMSGRFSKVIPATYSAIAMAQDGGFAYTLTPGTSGANTKTPAVPSVLKLNSVGQPTEWSVGSGDNRMVLAMSDFDEETISALPRRYSIQLGKEKNAILVIKERISLATPFTEQQLALDMPVGTQVKPLPHN